MPFTLTFQAFPAPAGPLRYAKVPWDSELYGFPFYELRCRDTPPEVLAKHLSPWLSSLPVHRGCLVYSKIPSGAIAVGKVFTHHGFYPVETLFELYLPLARLTPIVRRPHNQAGLRLAEEADLPEVIAVARSSLSLDRLHLDPNLPPGRADQRYAQWVENGFRAEEPVFVYEDPRSARIIGFVHTREATPKIVDLSLGAVNTTKQGTGLGALMFQAVLLRCQAQGYQIATTRCSINNLPIVNLLTRLGFRFRSAVTTLHWFRAVGEAKA